VGIVFENLDRAVVDGKTAYRGGAPICFPFFGMGTLLPLGTTLQPQHGRARTTVWGSRILESDNAVALTTRQPSGEGYGPSELSCELVYTLGDELQIRATIRNVGKNETPFQLAVHTYWATASPSTVVVRGLGNRYLDNLLGLTEHTEVDSSAPHATPVDRVYLDAAAGFELETDVYKLQVSTSGCSGAVLWNPGKDHHLSDVGSPDFICVESGVISPGVSLLPGGEHVVDISYRAELV
jgi:glucose-6-phosphate 1-epimerase